MCGTCLQRLTIPKRSGKSNGSPAPSRGFRALAAEQPKRWHEYVGAMTYAYNAQVHISTGHPPFDPVLSYPPGLVTMAHDPVDCTPRPAAQEKRAS